MIAAFKYIELILLYLVAPLIAYVLIYDYKIPLFMILLPMVGIFMFILFLDKNFDWKALWTKGFGLWDTTRIFILFVLSGITLSVFAYIYEREAFLAFLIHRPYLWLLVMVLYPLISVTAQEIMYRVLFFHRYSNILGNRTWLIITLNAFLFGYCHIIFQNWYAIIISFIGGLFFAYTYHHTRSFLAVCLEHSLYGCLLFTIGFGRYFFTGISNFS